MKKSGWTDNDRIFAAIVLCVLSFAVVLTGGFIAEKRSSPRSEIVIEEIVEETTRTSKWDDIWDSGAETVQSESVTSVRVSEESAGKKVNINTAAKDELETLEGIGEKTAEKIIAYRENTPFERIEDIMNVDGIGEKKFENIKNSICV